MLNEPLRKEKAVSEKNVKRTMAKGEKAMGFFKAGTSREVSERERRNRILSGEIAVEGMVLLKNDGVLPLEKEKKVALFGNGARHTVRGGTGSGEVNVRDDVNIEQGLKHAGFEVTTTSWLDRYDAYCKEKQEEYVRPLREEIEKDPMAAMMHLFTQPYQEPESIPVTKEDMENSGADTVIYVISRICGEGKDRQVVRGDYYLFEEDENILRLLTEYYRQVVVVLNVGGVIDTEFVRKTPGIGAVLLMSQAGSAGGDALGRILKGEVSPGGRLTATWAAAYEDYPSADTFGHRNGDLDDEYYREGIYVGYRYFDSFNIEPAYPFGYGLSYTEFTLEDPVVRAEGPDVRVSVLVTNTGKEYSGREVVQVYVSAPEGRLDKPYQELKGFAKTRLLAPGESQKLEVCFALRDMASYDASSSAWILEKGNYYVRVGNHSRNTHIAAALCLGETVVTEQAQPMFADPLPDGTWDFPSPAEPYSYPGEEEEKERAPKIHLGAGSIPVKRIEYSGEPEELENRIVDHTVTAQEVLEGKATVEDLTAQLTVEELADLCVGTQRLADTGNVLSFIGQASHMTPGAAGDTTLALMESRGIPNVVTADGPAGLRLSTFYAVDGEGNQVSGVGSYSFPGLSMILGEPKEEAPEGSVLHYQYCTAIPIGTLLAQTWDMELVQSAGDLVGGEMEEFGVTLWLAPGMNIQRNPLCGRNFEYYSEDPVLSGLCAAADTLGVQKHPGAGTTIKHFAFNNQEDNRMHVNEHIPERAAREIYLKGFEIAVKASQPMAVMSSYNLVGGIHTANSHDLQTKILRDEWGYKGIVMTDWGTTGGMEMEPGKTFRYGTSSPEGCIQAGNDLIMPGRQEDVEQIVRAVEEGRLSKGALQLCAKRLVSLALHSMYFAGKDC